jgi:predicted nucleic acid-binding protein
MVLDTSVCIDLLRESANGVDGPARRCLRDLGRSRLYLSFFSLCELNTGLFLGKRSAEERRLLDTLLSAMTLIHPDDAFPMLYGEAAAALLAAGTPIPVMDLLIGVNAKAKGLPVLTRDAAHFRRIPGLLVESYAS